VYFLARRAGLIATASVMRVESYAGLDEAAVTQLAERLGPNVAADAAYWLNKRHARYATFVWLGRVEVASYAPDDVHGRERSYRSAWIVRPASQDVYPACCEASRVCA
jgi:hypothetical protein